MLSSRVQKCEQKKNSYFTCFLSVLRVVFPFRINSMLTTLNEIKNSRSNSFLFHLGRLNLSFKIIQARKCTTKKRRHTDSTSFYFTLVTSYIDRFFICFFFFPRTMEIPLNYCIFVVGIQIVNKNESCI